MNEKERDELFKRSRRGVGRFIELHGKVNSLIDFINIIGKLKSEDFGVWHTRVVKESGGEPEAFLNEYVVLEISNFYTLAHLEKSVKLPEPPEYWEKLKVFRNAIPAHADKEMGFETFEDLEKLYDTIDEIGMPKILYDFHIYFIKCRDVFLAQDSKETQNK